MRLKLIQFVLRIASVIKHNVKYDRTLDSEKIKLINLGCGLLCLKGWLNIDGSLTALFGSGNTFLNKLLYKIAGSSAFYKFEEFNGIIKKCKLRWYNLVDGIPLSDGFADVVFSSHFLEHLDKDDGNAFLNEIHRVLKKDGLVRIVVPDLDVAVKMYNDGDVDKMQDLFFYTNKVYDFSAHKYNYNYNTLKTRLSEIGFTKIEKKAYQEGDCPNLDYLDIYPEHSLYVEATKE